MATHSLIEFFSVFLNANTNKECIMHFHIHIVSFYRLLDLLKSADDVTVYCVEKNP